MLGRELRTPPALVYGQPPDTPQVPAGVEYASQLRGRLEVAHEFAREQSGMAGVRQKRAYDQHTKGTHFQAGDLVWVYAPKRTKGKSPKLQSNWVGPCYVLERLGEVTYRVRLVIRGRVVVLHRDRLAPYRGMGRATGGRAGRTPPQSPASADDGAVGVLQASPHSPGGRDTEPQRMDVPVTPPGAGVGTEDTGGVGAVGRSRPRRRRRMPQRYVDYEVDLLGGEEY